MRVVGWHNGSPNNQTGAGYGVRLASGDRNRYFREEWTENNDLLVLELDNGEFVEVWISPSFWRCCIELRSARIGKWMLDQNLAPWPKGYPPRMELTPIGTRRFRLCRV